MPDPTTRMLRLLSLLQTHRYWPGPELADRLAVSPRTLRRDVDRLRELGYPVDATRGAAGGYLLQAGSDLPPLLLDDDEAVAIVVGLRTAADAAVEGMAETSVRALAKLEQVLPERLRRQVRTIGEATVATPFGGGPSVDPATLSVLARACRDAERVRFEYRRRDTETAQRTVEPHRLVSRGRRWYLVAWDARRTDWRTFRVDRISEPAPSGTHFHHREPPGGDAVAYVQQSIRDMPTRYAARITVDAPADEVRRLLTWFRADVRELGEDRCEVRTAGDSLPWMALGLGLLESDFEVHEPPELIEHVRAVGGRMARATAAAPRP